jgi:hypothetical protein
VVKSAWLGREDSNVHMLESKSAASLLGGPTSNNLAQN